MRLIGLRHITAGAALARDVLSGHHGDVPLLTRGTILSSRYVEALERAGIHAVYVDDELGRGIEVSQALSEETRRAATAALEHAFARARETHAAARELSEETVRELSEIVRLIAEEGAAGADDAALALSDLAASDAYTHQHSIDVTALGLLIGRRLLRDHGWTDFRGGRRFDGLEERLVQLGLGLMLHDIGKLALPQEVLAKPGPLTEAEWALVRTHPQAGLDLVSPFTLSALARSVIRSHHERWDGNGYPSGKAGEEIPQFARIAAVADLYDAVTSERPYSAARPPDVAWRFVLEGCGTAFDPEVVSVFRSLVAPYPPGAEIVLPDGHRGVVVSVRPERLESVRVRIAWEPGGIRVTPYELDVDLDLLVEPSQAAA